VLEDRDNEKHEREEEHHAELAKIQQMFSKVSALVYSLYKATVALTFRMYAWSRYSRNS